MALSTERVQSPSGVYKHVKEGLNPRDSDYEKNTFGEVLTPTVLIDELLDELPASIWKRADAKWLDPAAGTGHYLALVLVRLMAALSDEFPDASKRRAHIVGHMLYMVEINPSNVTKLRRLFGKDANIIEADFLDTRTGFTDYFDIILGNPPFQTTKDAVYVGAAGRRTLWEAFVKKGLSLVKPGGYLAFLTPSSWRRPESKLWNLMTRENHLVFLRIHEKADGKKYFDVQTRFDNYVLQKSHYQQKASKKIVDENGETHAHFPTHLWPFLPNFAFSTIYKIMTSDPEKAIPVIFDSAKYEARRISKKLTAKNKYPIVHTMTQKGLGILYASTKDPAQFVPKVILNANERQYPYNDHLGKYGMSQLSFGIPIQSKAEGEQWIRLIESPMFQDVLRATKWGAFQTDYRMFKYFRKDLFKMAPPRGTFKAPRLKKKQTRKIRHGGFAPRFAPFPPPL